MALNDPNTQKRQSTLDVPICRTSFSSAAKRTVQICKPNQVKSMAFNLSSDNDGQYWRKLKNFFDFLFKVNYSNNIYISLELNKPDENVNYTKYKVFIGKGNNSLLLKSLLKRRFWW